jgi:hypothetical protein
MRRPSHRVAEALERSDKRVVQVARRRAAHK